MKFLVGFSIFFFVFQSTLMARVPYRYFNRYRNHYKSRQVLAFQIQKMSAQNKIEKKKFKEAILEKLKQVNDCYNKWLDSKPSKTQKRKSLQELIPSEILQIPHFLEMQLQVNGLGRVQEVVFLNAQKFSSKIILQCIRWHFQGRRFFPPENDKKTLVTLQVKVLPVLWKAKNNKSIKKR